MMDRKLSDKDIRRKKMTRYVRIAAAIGGLVVISVVIANFVRPGLNLESVDTAQASKGTLEVSVGATGTVTPFYEENITSPISTKILEVYKKSGEQVHKGDTILRLDLSSANIGLQEEADAVEIQKYKLEQFRTQAVSEISDMEKQVAIDDMRLKRMKVLMTNEHYLDSIGTSTEDMVRQRELDYEVAKLQFEQLNLSYENKKKIVASTLKVNELEYGISERKLSLKRKEFVDAGVLAPFDATLSWVNEAVGSGVVQGGQLAILSDLSRFKVKAEISDSYAGQFNVGSRVEVKIGNLSLSGGIENIVPSVSDGKISFTVVLDDASNKSLRPGLRADVYVVTSIKENVIMIPNRAYYSGPGEYQLWIVNGGHAEKRTVLLGESSSLYVEVVDGIHPGETVIVSNMNEFKTKDKLKIR
ncbi:MAG: HlyD family efflux transporter periplasmic adaptor subunit [Paraprevotella sp.]|nr:HlyD family efflux transporter periplasmic adaptor subunit [Paraprevotella sp.]